jgi:hypothetical protein
MSTLRHNLPLVAIAAMVALFFTDLVLMSYGAALPLAVCVGKSAAVGLLAGVAARSAGIGIKVLLSMVMALAIAQVVTILLVPTGVVLPPDPFLGLIYLGCGAFGGLLGVVVLIGSIGVQVL